MEHKIKQNITIKISTWFREDLSDVEKNNYFFNYKIGIQNTGKGTVQLLSRYWKIEHLTLGSTVVSGEGVIGEQPILNENESFEYTSGCELWNPYGRMSGYYVFLNLETSEEFTIEIPSFKMVYPPLLN
jgi:ApaG protein